MNLTSIDPIAYRGWDTLVSFSAQGSIFHTSFWARSLCDAYGFKPHYLSHIEQGKLRICIPFMEVHGLFGGKRAVSLPFSDFCQPLASTGALQPEHIGFCIDYGRKRQWKSIEIRHTLSEYPISMAFIGHRIHLEKNEKTQRGGLRGSTWRNIKKAIDHGVTAGVYHDEGSMMEFCRLNDITRKKHGLPPQPRSFMLKVNEHIIKRDLGYIVLGRYNGKVVSGAVFLIFGNSALYKYGASIPSFLQVRPNNLVMWQGIREASSRNCSEMLLGRTESSNHGLMQFKSGWGSEEYQIAYWKYNLRKNSSVVEANSVYGWYNAVFRRLPLPVLRIIGSILYRFQG